MIRLALLLALLATPAFAQPQQRAPTAAEMQGALSAAIAQGEAARALHIQAEAKAAGLADENAKLTAKVQELEKKIAPTESPGK